MPCDHLGAPELMELAERELHERSVPISEWGGLRFRHGENLTGGMWASVVLEIERRGSQWILTRLDRNRESLPESELGLRRLG
jgi:hypothetical protein